MPQGSCFSFVYGEAGRVLLPVPDSTCTSAPPLNISCAITSGDLNIGHNTIDANTINNQPEIKATVSVQCTGGSVSVNFASVSGDGTIDMGAGLKSQLTIDDKKLTNNGVNLNVNVGNNLISLGSKLIADGQKIEPGDHKGSATIMMNYN